MLSKAFKMDVIENALEAGNNVKVSYVSVKGEESERVVQPEEFLYNDRIFVGFDIVKNAYRRFVIDNIVDVQEVSC